MLATSSWAEGGGGSGGWGAAAVHVAVCMSDGITIFVVDNDLAKTAKATYQASMTERSVRIIEK